MKTILITIAIAGIGVAGLAAQQAPAARYTPAPNAKDKRGVLFNWAWYMGMLRGPQEIEAVISLEQKATGTLQVNGQACTLSSYRVSTNYPNAGQRVQYACRLASGQEVKNIEVVSGTYAWDEDIVGAELVPGKGKATPKPAALRERLIRLWSGPQGAVKAANAGGDKTTVAEAAGKITVTYPIPGVPGAVATATLDAKNMAERIEVKDGNTVTEFTYANYADYNNPLNKIDALYAGRIVEKRGGVTVRDLTTTETETGNLYVVMPVPPSVKKASPQSN
ncbi:MAG TPA: hypothetical protein VN654_28250 [Vicinamibacterales bacterium]|nr:hypothetical protein [Vicinamibacterales bacterium]